MSRRIVFAGGVQTRALARIFRGEVAGQTGDDVVFIGTGAVGTDAARSTLLLADVVVMEVDEDGDAIPGADLPTRADIVRVPNLYCDFLWPFAGRAHPKNRGAFTLPGGPYPAEHGDRVLDQMMAENMGEDAAIRRYLNLNIAVDGELEGRLTDRLAIMERLDAAGGYDLTGFVRDKFRAECLFRTRQRLTMPLLARLVDQLFAKLKVAGWKESDLKRVPFPAGAQPVHPGVIKHFGLTWTIPEAEYPVNDEGYFTFEEFCRRYMRFEWNEALHRGIQAARSNPSEAIADLTAALRVSPDSMLGQKALTVARHEAGLEPSPAAEAINLDEESYDPSEEIPPEPVSVEPEVPVIEAAVTEADPVAPAITEAAPAAEAPPSPGVATAAAVEPVVETPAAEPEIIPPAPTAEPVAPPRFTAAPAKPAAPLALDDEAAPAPVRAEVKPAPKAPPPKPEQASTQDGFTDFRPAADAPKPEPKPAPKAAGPKPEQASTQDGFTDFRPAAAAVEDAEVIANPGSDLIEVLPSLLPVFKDLSSAVDRPYNEMPELLPPPPLRPVLPPELQGEAPKQGFLAKLLGKK